MRRTRFTALCTDAYGKDVSIHVMHFSQAQALDLLHRRRPDWTVHSVLPAAQAAAREGGGFRLDKRALREACALLGIERPVKVRFNGRYGGTQANHRFRPDGTHDIMLKSYLTPKQASESLWHELQHAVQAERAGDYHAWQDFTRDQRRYPYKVRPIEVEARATAAMMADCPLTIGER